MDVKSLIEILSRDRPKTIQELIRDVQPETKGPPRRKRRKTDKRTLAKRKREYIRNSPTHRATKRVYDSSLAQQYYHLRREVNRRQKKTTRANIQTDTSWEWELKLHEWVDMWGSCPAVEVGLNVWRPAWRCRGRKKGAVQLRRIYPTLPWRRDNIMITKGKEILYEPSAGNNRDNGRREAGGENLPSQQQDL